MGSAIKYVHYLFSSKVLFTLVIQLNFPYPIKFAEKNYSDINFVFIALSLENMQVENHVKNTSAAYNRF